MNPWVALAAFVGTGLLILLILRPTPVNGERLLKKWGVAEPTLEQVAEAVLYLRRRRMLYPWLYAALWLVPKFGDSTSQLAVVVLAGTLLAELLALRPRRHARRMATLAPRGLFDIASRWVLVSYVVITAGVAVFLGIVTRWAALGWLAVSVLAVAVIIWAAVARPASGHEDVDMALRTRSVHVAAGLGVAVAAGVAVPAVVAVAGAAAGPVAGLVGVLAWVWMANTRLQQAKSVQ